MPLSRAALIIATEARKDGPPGKLSAAFFQRRDYRDRATRAPRDRSTHSLPLPPPPGGALISATAIN